MFRDIFKYGFSNLWITEKQGFVNFLQDVTKWNREHVERGNGKMWGGEGKK